MSNTSKRAIALNEDSSDIGAGKKIVFFVSFMNVAGAQEAAMRAARGLRAHGYETEVWFFYREAANPDHVSDPGVRVLLDTEKPNLRGYLKIARVLYAKLRREKPYATISFLPLANVMGQSMAWLAGVKRRIASARAPISTYSKPMRMGDAFNARMGIYTSIMAVTGEVAKGYSEFSAKVRQKVRVVYNGLHHKPAQRTKDEARAYFGLPAHGVLVASVGRFKEQKNYPFQIEFAAKMRSAYLVVAGDGPLRPEIEAQIDKLNVRERVILLGNVNHNDMPDLLEACDIFIQPSLYEGQSNALLEAMHADLPLVVSDVPEQRETMIDEDTGVAAGMLLPLNDPEIWAQTLDRLAENPVERSQWAVAARARAGIFTPEAQVRGVVRIIEQR